MDDWGKWRLNSNMNRMIWIFVLLANITAAQQSPLRASTNADMGNGTNKSAVAVPMDVSRESFLPKNLKDWIDLIQGASVIIASCVAIFGINAWRKEFVGKRRIELAEEVLALFYQAKDIIAERFYACYGHSDRKAEAIETPKQKQVRDLAYVTIEWFCKYDEIFSRIYTLRYRVMAQFPEGKNAAAPFNELQSICVELRDKLSEYVRLSEVDSDPNKWTDQAKFREHQAKVEDCRKFIWRVDKDDPLSPRLKEIIEHIERICRRQICGVSDPEIK